MKCECILEKLRMDETGEDKIDGFINKLEDYVKEIIHLITEPTDECFVKLSEGKNDCIERMNILKKSIKELEPIYSDFADIIVKLRQGKSNLESICNDESDLMEKDIYLPDNYGSHYDKIVRSFNELGDIVRQIKYFIAEPTDKCFEKFPGGKEICIKRMNTLKKSKQKLEHLFCEFVAFLSKLDSLQSVEDQLNLEPVPDPKVQDANDWTERMKHLPNSGSYWVDHRSEMEENVFKFESKLTAFENVSEIKEISEKEMSDLRILSEMLIKYMPMLEDPCSEIDDILYENDEHKVVEEKDCHIAPDLLLPFHDKIHDIGHVYFFMVFDKNIVNQCLDNAFRKLVEHRGWRRTLRLDGNIVHLLQSKDMYQICLGLKLCKTYSKANGFKKRIEQDLYCAISYLTKIPEFVDDQNVNKMARFVAKHAKGCHDLIKEKDKLPEIPAYRARDIFMRIKYGEIIGQYEIRALYEIIKSCKSPSKVLSILLGYGKIEKVVTVFLRRIRYCYMQYEALDKEMRKIDRQNGQEFGGFSLEIVADDDVKKPLCASDSLEKSTFYKYFFYDDAMMTFSILSFLYNCFEKDLFYSYEAQQFKMASVLTKVVLDLIHQRDTTKKVNKPIWIIEKILNTCHFIVFGQDEKKEKDIFLKLVNEEKIDEDELISLKGFMKKNNLSYKDIERDFDTVEENEHGDEDIDCDFDALESENSYEDMDYD